MPEKPELIAKAGLFVLFVYITTSYFYFFKTGIPQVSGYIMAVGIVFVLGAWLTTGRFRVTQGHFWGVMFALWTFLINIIHYVSYPEIQFFLSSLYYLYNVSIFIFISMLFRYAPNSAMKTMYAAVTISLVAQIFICIFYPNLENGRVQGSFHNPNQLAYWALFSASIMLLLRSGSRLKWYDLLIFAGFGLIQVFALSKAGLIAYGCLALGLPFLRIMPAAYRSASLLGVLFLAIVSIFHFAEVMDTARKVDNISNVISRIENIGGEADDSLMWRGYYRLVQYPEYMIIGAGEGGYDRFFDTPQPVEIHSTLANLLFSYGLMGVFLFFTFLYSIAIKAPRHFMLVIFAILLNGLSHQNMRFSHFWVVLGTAYGMAYATRNRDFEISSGQSAHASLPFPAASQTNFVSSMPKMT